MIVSGDPPIKTTKSPAKPHAGTKLSFHAPTAIIRQFYVVVVVVVVVLMKTDYRESILTLVFFYQGYVVAWCERLGTIDMQLVKLFSKKDEEAWEREVKIALLLNEAGSHSNVLQYRWHSPGGSFFYI